MKIVIELNKEKAAETSAKVAQGTAVIVSGLFSLGMSTLATAWEVGKATHNQLKQIK